MKNLILLLVASLLGSYAYFGIYKSDLKKKEIEKNTKIGKYFNKNNVDKIELIKNDNITSSFIKKDGFWSVITPLNDLADQQKLEKWVESLTQIDFVHILDKDKSYNPSIYGFDKPFGKIKITSSRDSKIKTFIIGGVSTYDNQIYVLDKDIDDKIFVLNPKYRSYFQQQLISLRDKNLWRTQTELKKMNAQDVVDVHFSLGDRAWRLVKKNNKWTYKPDLSVDSVDTDNNIEPHKIDDEIINEYIGAFLDLKIKSFDEPLKKKTNKTPEFFDLLVTIKDKNNQEFKLKVLDNHDSLNSYVVYGKDGNNPDKYKYSKKRDIPDSLFVKTNFLAEMVKVDRENLLKIVKSLSELYQRKWPFEFDKNKVSKIKLFTEINKNLIVKKNESNSWSVASGNKLETMPDNALNQDSVEALLNKLSSLKTDHFNYSASKSLDQVKEMYYIHLYDSEDTILFKIAWGDKYKANTALFKKENIIVDVFTIHEPLGYNAIIASKLENIDKDLLSHVEIKKPNKKDSD